MEEQFSMDYEMMECIGGNMVMKKCCGVHTLRIAVGITMLGLLLVGSANASTFTVCPGGCAYSSIQKAIIASSNGDTILVKNGTYFENVNVNKKLILRGVGNPVVDAGGNGSAIMLASDGITLEGFTATGSGGYYDFPVAGIKVTSSNNILTGNNASNNFGGGIYLSFSSSNNTLKGNNASNNSIGIYLSSSSNNTLSQNMMTGNQKNFDLQGNNDTDFENHIDKNNLVDGRPLYYIIKAVDTTYGSLSNAGTLYCISCINVTIKNLNFNKNGKGIYFWNTSQSTIQNVSASNNSNGIYLSNSSNNTLIGNNCIISLSLSRHNTLTGNNASNNSNGTGIWLFLSSKNTLTGNNASNNSNGIYLYGSSKNTLTGNNASNNNDGIFLSSSRNNIISRNDASNNVVGIFLAGGSKNKLNGNNASNNNGGISLDSSSKNNTLRGNNVSKNRIGISLRSFSNNNALDGNNASNNSNGIYLYGSSKNTLTGNNASNNSIGIYMSSSSNNTLSGNNASNNYLGISLKKSINNKIYNNIFSNKHNVKDFRSINIWNTTMRSSTNIVGGFLLGGNFWAKPDRTGFSQTCRDVNGNGICDISYILGINNIDYLPLANNNIPPKSVRNPRVMK